MKSMAYLTLCLNHYKTTRRFDALKLWMTIESLGEELYGSMIDHGVKLTREVADYIKATDGLRAFS